MHFPHIYFLPKSTIFIARLNPAISQHQCPHILSPAEQVL